MTKLYSEQTDDYDLPLSKLRTPEKGFNRQYVTVVFSEKNFAEIKHLFKTRATQHYVHWKVPKNIYNTDTSARSQVYRSVK